MMRTCLLFASVLFLATGCNLARPTTTAPAAAPAEKPNVLLLIVDDMNDWVRAFGGNNQAVTPNLDRFAARAVRFDNAYCSAPLCNPSRTSLLTGLSPLRTGVHGNKENFRDQRGFADVVTLPQHFAANGYATFASGKIFHSPHGPKEQPRPGSDPGSFQEEWRGGLGVKFPPAEERFSALGKGTVKGKVPGPKNFDWQPIDIADEATADWQIANYGAQVLSRQHEKPFFLAVGIFRPHLPWYAPKKYFDLYDPQELRLPDVQPDDLADVGRNGNNYATNKLHDLMVEKGKWQEAMQGYLASLSFADACAGHLLGALEKSAFADNTIVVVMGDHGWNLGEKQHWGKNVLWEESAKTPLMIFDPRRPSPVVTDRVVSLLDVYPTLVELCGLTPRSGLDGESIAGWLRNPALSTKNYAVTVKNDDNLSLRTQAYRYTRYSDGTEELYNHMEDPLEWNNLATDPGAAKIITGLRRQLKVYEDKMSSK
ncbi:sulfatase [Neolewinella aurantiaca]|uniref:Sulfatase n=1 Tax=Neolewinella aurantiaca TaxID=2602767 RepID=A0A5C7FEN2_9BACT|nr:sulfatase [Neolewinella aurantiaca]TXF87961.1 sulfatase [Neolewinella aurantiaca]